MFTSVGVGRIRGGGYGVYVGMAAMVCCTATLICSSTLGVAGPQAVIREEQTNKVNRKRFKDSLSGSQVQGFLRAFFHHPD